MSERDEALYLTDIVEAIDQILAYTSAGRDVFFSDRMIQDAVVRNLEIIGEAVKGLSETTRQAHPEVPWKAIAGTRDRVIHGYFKVSIKIVCQIVEKELPMLRSQIAGLLSA
ncbi:MAG TPA: DUF86 domain-containing protein [Solirubrobacterales bacterium]